MFRFYTPVLILQAFCIYHAYKTGRKQTWFFLIIFLPLIGCGLYLYDTFVTRRNLEELSEGIKQMANSNRKIELLEKALKLSNTSNNKIVLADAYLEVERIDEAIDLYNSCLVKGQQNIDLLKQLIKAHFLKKEYSTVVQYGNQLKGLNEFRRSEARIDYAWSLYHAYDKEKALKEFESMDARFSNYPHRFEYAKFLLEIDQKTDCKNKLEELIEEYKEMATHEKRFKKDVYRKARELYYTIK